MRQNPREIGASLTLRVTDLELFNGLLAAILVWFEIDDIDDVVRHAKGIKFTVTFADIVTASEVRSILTTVGLEASAASVALHDESQN